MVKAVSTPTPIPQMPGSLPIFGNFLEIRRDRLGFFLRVLEHCGDIGQYRRMSRTVFFLADPAHIQTVLVDQAEKINVPRRAQLFLRPILGDGLMTSDKETHAHQRHLVAPAFHHDRIAQYAQTIAEITQAFQRDLSDGQTIDVLEEMLHLALGIVGKTLFGADLRSEANELGSAVTTALELTNVMAQSPLPLPRSLPTSLNRRFQQAIVRLNDTMSRLIAQRRASAVDTNDVLSMLLQMRDEHGKPMTDTQVRDQAMTIFLAGYETTAIALTWAWYLLSQHPAAYAELRNEVDRVLAGRVPTTADLPQLPYTRQVLKEALRLYPPIHLITRQVGAEPISLAGGYQLPAGAYFVVSFYAVHRRPDTFPDPQRFAPERWTPEFERQLPHYAYLPFSAGPRSCLGEHFALMSIQLVLATLAQHVIFEPVTRDVTPKALLTLRPKSTMHMIIRRRG